MEPASTDKESLSRKSSSEKSTDDDNIAGTPALASANNTLFGNLLIEPDHGLFLVSQLPRFDITWVISNTSPTHLALLIDRHYYAFQSPASLPSSSWTWRKATNEVITLRKTFSVIKEVEDSILAMTAWYHFLCDIDDEIEQIDSLGRDLILGRIIEALQAISLDRLHRTEHIKPTRSIMDILKRANIQLYGRVPLTSHQSMVMRSGLATFSDVVGQEQTIGDSTERCHARVLALASSFIRQCQVVLAPQTLSKVFGEVINVLEALKKESTYRESTVPPRIEDYLRLRMQTIGLSPFFAILADTLVGTEAQNAKGSKTGNNNDQNNVHGEWSAASSSNDSSGFWISPLHKKFRDSIQRTIGLQNDIIGLAKDLEQGERMNLCLLLLEQGNQNTQNLEAMYVERAKVVSMHNTEMQNAMRCWTDIEAANYSPAVQLYARSLVAFTRTHFTWAMHTHRYHSKHITISGI